MNEKTPSNPSRRQIMAFAATATLAGTAQAATKAPSANGVPALSKASVGYRDVAWHGKACQACVWFEPPAQGGTAGHCHLVAGPISAAGWCQAWTASK